MTAIVDHLIASETYRLETFSNLLNFPLITRHQLALAGFVYRDSQCLCAQCGVTINLISLDENIVYASNYFRKLHREKISHLGKRCTFLLCESGTNIDDLHAPLPLQQEDKPQWDDAEQPEFNDYTIRLQTFHSWPYSQQDKNTFVTPSVMATNGFHYSGPGDGVTCFYCGNTLTDWSDLIDSSNESIVRLEHARFFPCRFIMYTAGGKFVASAGYFHAVSDRERRCRNPMTSISVLSSNKPQSIDQCLLTFENWPEYAPIAAKDLAETGFYYLGSELKVKCYMCDLEVDDWRHGMTAVGTHSRRRADCEIMQAILCTKTSDIQCIHEKWRLQTLIGLSFDTNDDDERLCQELAAAGFYRFKNTRNIRCAYCGVLIQPKADSSIMFQHRYLAKQLRKSSTLDCLMVRAQCPTNIVIPDRAPFPEYPDYQSVFDRIKSFESYQERYKVLENFIRERADAGFFLDTMKRMRCFQCGNSLSINDKKRYEKYSIYNIAKLHAYFYPTCEWVKEILGCKYVAQVLLDRRKLNEREHQRLYTAQSSSTSPRATLDSFSSESTISGSSDLRSPNDLTQSDYSDESDDEGYETVATPFRAYFSDHKSPTLPITVLDESPTLLAAEVCTDINPDNSYSRLTSPILINQSNPFQQLASPSKSPPVDLAHTDISPVDPQAFFAYESNRLDSFKKLNRDTFAQVKIDEIAYAGFYLNAEGTAVRCPWCSVEITEQRFEKILCRRPIIPRSPLNDEPWTAMRVHRHEYGQLTDRVHSWCPLVRRDAGGLYSNISMHRSHMRYPEYPTYSAIEKRIKSFESDWIYPSGSRLSNAMMADAGFIYLGEGKVCCYYCGNKLCDFKPLDCPFEEHAVFNPLCDYMIQKRGLSFIERIWKESLLIPHARQKYETDGTQKIKYIFFAKTGRTPNKDNRPPVKRINSRSSAATSRNKSYSTTTNLDSDENHCHLCWENLAAYSYDPCQHCPMCGECFAKLTKEQHEECIICRRQATIHSRVPIIFF